MSSISSNTLSQSNYTVLLPDAAYTVLESDSGKTLFIPVLTANRNITLPPPKMGLHYRFYAASVAAALGFTATILPAAAGGALMRGSLANIQNAGATGIVQKNGAANAIFNAAAVQGDYMDLNCNGADWYINGLSTVAGGLA